MKPFYKTYTFWISVCLWLATLGGHYATVIPAPYGLCIANAVVIVYAVMRCLQKRSAGEPWRGIFFTSEFMISSITALINFLEALSAIPSMSPKALALISAALVGLVSLLHTLGGATNGTKLSIPVVNQDDIDTKVNKVTPIRSPETKKETPS